MSVFKKFIIFLLCTIALELQALVKSGVIIRNDTRHLSQQDVSSVDVSGSQFD